MAKHNEVKVIIGEKVWLMPRKMANATIQIAKQKYIKENVNAIVAIEKADMVIMRKDVFDNTDSFVKEITSWEHGGYKCYYVTKKG